MDALYTDWCYPQVYDHLLPLVATGNIALDLGCGTGHSSLLFAQKGALVTAIDNVPDNLGLCREEFIKAGVDHLLTTLTFDATEFLRVTPQLFDFVIVSDLITHFLKSDGLRLIALAAARVKPGGYLFLTAPSVNSDTYLYTQAYFAELEKDTYLIVCDCSGEEREEPHSFYRPDELTALLCEAGLSIISAEECSPGGGGLRNILVAHHKI